MAEAAPAHLGHLVFVAGVERGEAAAPSQRTYRNPAGGFGDTTVHAFAVCAED